MRMASGIVVLTGMALVCGCASQAEREGTAELKPGLVTRTLNIFRGSPERIKEAGVAKTRRLELSLKCDPDEVKLSETRRLNVQIMLANRGGKIVNLQFPTSQRIEIQLTSPTGEVVTRWSEDRAFSQEAGHVAINPGERLEYNETISLRDLEAGRSYLLEVFLPGYPGLSESRTINPVR